MQQIPVKGDRAAHGKVRLEMTAIPHASGGGSRRIIFDGLNLSLARGTGIATYTRMLTRAAHDLGHEVGVLYSTPFTPAKDRLLREIAFFDEKRPSMSGKRKLTLRRILCHCESMRDERRICLNGKADSKPVNEVLSLLLTRKETP